MRSCWDLLIDFRSDSGGPKEVKDSHHDIRAFQTGTKFHLLFVSLKPRL